MRSILSVLGVLIMSWSVQAEEPFDAVAERLEAGDYSGVTSGIVSLDGQIKLTAYAPGVRPTKRHDIRSATKSITALLVGELIEDGSLTSLDTKISELLPETFSQLPEGDARRDIRIEDALTMRTGLACNDWVPASVAHEDKMYKTKDWMQFLLKAPMAFERGKHFSYCTGGVVLLGRVIERVSGMSVPDFAEARLFGPLGIDGATWERTPAGHTDTGGHLRLNVRDMHKIGLLVAASGLWKGTQVVDATWIDNITSEQTDIYGRREKYGFLLVA